MAHTKHILSKSTFMYGCQCRKRLFLHKFKREWRNPIDDVQQAIFDGGTNVGELARHLFPHGVDASPPNSFSYHISVEKTQALIKRDVPIIYEAAFQYEGVLCAVDILVKQGKSWYAFEVKSSTSVKEQHIRDAALQYYVMRNCGLLIEDISIIHINNQYTRKGNLDIRQLFATESILARVKAQQEFIAQKVIELIALLAQRDIPAVDIGPHCYEPYACDFSNHCWANISKDKSVFDLVGGVGWELYGAGYKHLDEIPEDYEMNSRAQMQLKHYRSGEVYVDKKSIAAFIEPIKYPLYFFDFETIMPGIPEFDDSRPYQQIPFQFSLHVLRHKGSEVEHYEYLGDGLTDPRPLLADRMVELLGNAGSIICYNMSFEKNVIAALANTFPKYETALLEINQRIFDLMVPFQKRWYYHPKFNGSYSIKAVLPAIVPELNYTDLDIQEGGTASLIYSQLKFQTDSAAVVQRAQLQAYCKLDTLAMVKIWEHLQKTVEANGE